MADKPSTFVWHDLMTTDTHASAAFYSNVLGWQATEAGMGGPPYFLLSLDTATIGGLMAAPPDASSTKPTWMVHIGVEDVDACSKRVREAGGAIHRAPQDIPSVGRFAVVADPHGATFILFQPNSAPPAAQPDPTRPGNIGWHELHAGDGDAAFAFYSGLFGWTKAESVDMGRLGMYHLFAAGGPPIGGIMTQPPGAPAPFWMLYFTVDAIDAAMERVQTSGGEVSMHAHQVPGGSWIAHCADPQGAVFGIAAASR